MNQWKRAIETWFTGKEEQMVRQIADLVAVPSVGGESAGPCQPFGEGPAKALEVALLQAQGRWPESGKPRRICAHGRLKRLP